MKNITIEDVIYINDLTIKKHGGTKGIKNISLIESSLNSGLATFDGQDLYPKIEDKNINLINKYKMEVRLAFIFCLNIILFWKLINWI